MADFLAKNCNDDAFRFILALIMNILIAGTTWFLLASLAMWCIKVGANNDKSYWEGIENSSFGRESPPFGPDIQDWSHSVCFNHHYIRKPATWNNIGYWFFTGLALMIYRIPKFFFLTLPFWIVKGIKIIFIGIYLFICIIPIFLIKLTVLIHTQERLTCGIYSVIGGTLTAIYAAPQPFMSAKYYFFVLCSGLVSAGLGLVARKFVLSKLVKKTST